ncbi:hypothetical protein [Paraburkholderia phenoliruptrix]|uniref:hypothetical protein n=1 Tax=Paraburkholderia phenoliruptrix TaxID=252970 RepID=UPI0028699C07|nr:hypothetical protein [Paraburkholderia phenoliruptrix]WMY10806.1 hypothetical protein P3F88_29400 [Paraburkholderia phenoliruptrix]
MCHEAALPWRLSGDVFFVHIPFTIIQHCPLSPRNTFPLFYVSTGSCPIPLIRFALKKAKEIRFILFADFRLSNRLMDRNRLTARPRPPRKTVFHTARLTLLTPGIPGWPGA